MRPLLTLVMIVRNESASIREVLEAVKPHIDAYMILDTGSIDDTTAIVRETMGDMPGKLVEEPFTGCVDLGLPEIIDFAATRNRALDLAAVIVPSEFQLMLSGDEYLRGGVKLREVLEAKRETSLDLFWLEVLVNNVAAAPQPRVFRTGSAWRYRHEVHEMPVHPVDDGASQAYLDGVVVEHDVANHEARLSNIWDQHVPVLKAMLERDPKDARALVFLAQSYEALLPFMQDHEKLMHALEAMGLYIRRRALPFSTDAERLHVELNYLDFARGTGIYSDIELYARAEALHKSVPDNPEVALVRAETAIRARPLTEVYEMFKQAAELAAAYVPNHTGVRSTEVGWKAHRYAAVAAKQIAAKIPERAEEFGARVREHIAAGLSAGGTWEVFKSIVTPPQPAP